ncbi:uncharacterized protein LOC116428360 isoform X1 [Nomia melanderi]|uniref:uncharacterized protein LOC116428360 isoform X1 n=1 Tax=Nomia melanderi TaxID=2448451 RepID=UPI0013041EA6|nr:uncharacterized protein LOC116428360 isoform X1 [Nomia melanderi]
MTGLGNRAFPILFWSIAAAWTAAVPVSVSVPVPVQAGTSGVQRNMYGPTAAEILAAYLEDQGRTEEKPVDGPPSSARDSDRDGNRNINWSTGRRSPNAFVSEQVPSTRLDRNLDQIGGGNLLRGLSERETARDRSWWSAARRNLDQIGGGNLLRSADDRLSRNLDQIGGGNLVRDTSGDFRRNLDQIGGGNLVRDLAGAVRRFQARAGDAGSRDAIDAIV